MATNLATIAQTAFSAGITNSGTFVFPSTGFSGIQVIFAVAAADITDASKSFTFSVLVQQPDTSFSVDSFTNWVGGSSTTTDKFGNVVPNTGTTLNTSVSSLVGKTCKIQLNAPNGVTTAITVNAF